MYTLYTLNNENINPTKHNAHSKVQIKDHIINTKVSQAQERSVSSKCPKIEKSKIEQSTKENPTKRNPPQVFFST